MVVGVQFAFFFAISHILCNMCACVCVSVWGKGNGGEIKVSVSLNHLSKVFFLCVYMMVKLGNHLGLG